jgi:hypothetical protein
MGLMERFLPRHQFAERHHLGVRCDASPLLDAAERVVGEDDPLVNRLIAVREAPARLLGRLGLSHRLPQRPFGLADFTPLGRDGDQEIAFGLAGRFWQSDYGLEPVASAEAFLALRDTPKLVMNFVAFSNHDGQTMLATHTRVFCPDATSLQRFAPYWYLIRPVSGLIRLRLLRRIARAAAPTPSA